MAKNLFLLPGDGIGPEAMGEVRKIIAYMNDKLKADFVLDEALSAAQPTTPTALRSRKATWQRPWPPMRFCSAPLAVRNGMRCL